MLSAINNQTSYNTSLVEMKRKSIELVDTGNAEGAVKILQRKEYWDQKKIYEQSLINYIHGEGAEYDEALSVSTAKIDSANHRAQNLIKTSTHWVQGLTIFAFVLLTGIGGLIFYSITNSLTKLKAAMVAIGHGRLDTQIKINSNDEIGQLAACFSKMAEDLSRTTTSVDNLNQEMDERKRAEQQREELLKELEKVNGELKEFAYVMSHDLKAPLRGIKTIAEWLAADYADKVDDSGREQLGLLQSRVERMHNLIEGVLQYSRIGRVKEQEVRVDLNELVTEAIDMVAAPENIPVTIEGKLPEIVCERTRIGQIFQNLISNAVKYMDKPQGRVKIRCKDKDNLWEFSVSDNGPGIEEKHFEQIFKIFQTLHSKDEYESTGIGLTLVRKIVELYGGRIWVQSKVGEGSTFYFTLPKRKIEVRDEMTLFATC